MYSPNYYQIAIDRNREDQMQAAQARLLPTSNSAKSWIAKAHLAYLFQPNRFRIFNMSAAQS